MPQDPRVEEILREIDELFGDTSVSKEQTLEWMQEIQGAVDGNVDALKSDIEEDPK